MGTPQKSVNCKFSTPEFDGVRKLSISDAEMRRFSRIGKKIKTITALSIFWRKTENFRSTEHYGAPLDGLTFFICRSSLDSTAMESCRLPELKYAIFSRAGRKTKKLPLSKLFLSMAFKHGLLEGSTFLFQYSSMTCAQLESCRLGDLKYAISQG